MSANLTELGFFDRERFSPLTGEPLVVLDCNKDDIFDTLPQAVVVGVDRVGAVPPIGKDRFDILLTVAPYPPAPWVACENIDSALDVVVGAVRRAPMAASVLVEILRMSGKLSFKEALTAESLAYSMLLRGAEFARWLEERDQVDETTPTGELVAVERTGSVISLDFDHPERSNAISAPMRDALYEALVNALEDPTRPRVEITGSGRCFSVGGHLPEFGSASDPARAHRIRIQRSLAWLLHLMRDRAEVRFHGACIGSGLEIFAAVDRRIAQPGSWFQLPELSMGLIPGAGGTVTVSEAIGRHRAGWMMLTGKRVGAPLAIEWGLVEPV